MPARIALTTTRRRASKLAADCRAQDLEPVFLPCIEFATVDEQSLESARATATRSDWLIITSSRAIEAMWPRGGMPAVPVAAVGPSTARTVRSAGGTPALVGNGGAADLVTLLVPHAAGRSICFPHAVGADLATIRMLESVGASVHPETVYEIRPIAPDPDSVDAVVFGSPTAVAGWFRSRSLDGLVVGAIGTTTAGALSDHAVDPDVTSPRPSFRQLIELLAQHFGDRSTV